MPRCEGLLDGRCPQNVNNRTVKLTQGDLMLCPSCDAVRFPHPCATKSLRSQSSSNVTTQKRKTSTVTATTSVSARKDSVNSCCPSCSEQCQDDDSKLICELCDNCYHKGCTGLSSDVFEVLITIVHQAGWVCCDCRDDRRGRLNKLDIALAKTNESLADVTMLVANLQKEIEHLKAASAETPVANATHDDETNENETVQNKKSAPVDINQVRLEIHRTHQDAERRKRNVVITGLPEPNSENVNSAEDDKEADNVAFSKFCEKHLSVKPALARSGCMRLGKRIGQRPRRLLVRLTSESSATSLLAAAKSLRQSEDTYVATTVYINADLTPLEAQLAYEQRKARRDRRSAIMATSLNVDAVPFEVQADACNTISTSLTNIAEHQQAITINPVPGNSTQEPFHP